MSKITIYIILFLVFNFSFSQELYFKTGKNFTTYDYLNSKGLPNPTLRSGDGNFFEFGYLHYFNHCRCNYYRFFYSASIVLNDFNATGGNVVNKYTWDAQFLGTQGILYYSLFPDNDFNVIPKLGFGVSTLLSGNQAIDGVGFNLANENEFKGIFIAPSLGIDLKYSYFKNTSASIGYSLSKVLKFNNSSNEKLSFLNHQIQFGLYFEK